MDLGLKGAHVLITGKYSMPFSRFLAGASGGIGLATAQEFLNQGCFVTMQYHKNISSIEAFLKDNDILSINPVQADVTIERQVASMFSSLPSPVEILVVNRGYWPTKDVPLARMTLQQWQSTVDINLTSPFLVVREYLKQLSKCSEESKARASIVLTGSTAGKFGEANHTDYAASKSALIYGFTLSLKNEIVKIAPRGRVNCIAPGWVRTPMAETALKDPEVVYRSLATTPLKKFAAAKDIAVQILALSSPVLSRHVTGQVVMVDGGMEGRLLNKPEDISGDP